MYPLKLRDTQFFYSLYDTHLYFKNIFAKGLKNDKNV